MNTTTRVLSPMNFYTFRPLVHLDITSDIAEQTGGKISPETYIVLAHNENYGVPSFTNINPNTWKYLNEPDLLRVLEKIAYDAKDSKPTIHGFMKALTAFSNVHRGEIKSFETNDKYFCPFLPNFAISSDNLPTILSTDGAMLRFIPDVDDDELLEYGLWPCITFCPEKVEPMNDEAQTDDHIFGESAVVVIDSLPSMLSNNIRYIGIQLAVNAEIERRYGEDFYGVIKLERSESLDMEEFATFIAEHGDTFICGRIPDEEIYTFSSSNMVPALAWQRLRDIFKRDAKHIDTFSSELRKVYDPVALHKEVKVLLNSKYTKV